MVVDLKTDLRVLARELGIDAVARHVCLPAKSTRGASVGYVSKANLRVGMFWCCAAPTKAPAETEAEA